MDFAAQEVGPSEVETDGDMSVVRPPDGLMTTERITAGNCTPTLMTCH